MASAIAPPTMVSVRKGKSSQRESRPTWSVEWVSWKSWNGAATAAISLPKVEIVCPMKSLRKAG